MGRCNSTADGPPLGRGQSAVVSRTLSRDVAVSGGLATLTAGGPPRGAGQSAGRIRNCSRDVVVSGGSVEWYGGRSAT